MTADMQELEGIVRTMTDQMGVACEVAAFAAGEEDPLTISIQAPQDARLLIGKDGQNLRAFEHVLRLMWARRDPRARSLIIDVNDYRKARAAELTAVAHEAARRVRDTRRPEAMDPMTPYERRVVHTELAAYHDVATESIGQEPHRRVVIKPL